MQPKVKKASMISGPSEDSAPSDAIVEASNAEQEPQLLDNYDLLGCNPSGHGARHGSTAPQEATDDVNQVESAKKARPKRSPKKKVVAVGEVPTLRYIDQFNAIESCIPTPQAIAAQPKEDEPKEDEPKEEAEEVPKTCQDC